MTLIRPCKSQSRAVPSQIASSERVGRAGRCLGQRADRASAGSRGDAGRRFFRRMATGRCARQDRGCVQRHHCRESADGAATGAGRPGRGPGGAHPASREVRPPPTAPGARWRPPSTTLIDDLLWPTTEVTRAIAAVAQGKSASDRAPGRRRAAASRASSCESATIVNTMIKQLSVFTSEVTRVAREVGTEGKLGGQAQVREVTGVWKDLTESVNSMASNLTGAGPQHRRSDHRGRQRRPVEEDHRRRARRDPPAQGSHQHDGRSAALLRLRGDARRPRGRHRRKARRPGDRAGRRRHLEGSDRLGQRDVRQPHRSGAQHRPGDDRGRARRPVAQDHGRCARRDPRAEGHHQHHGRSAQRLRLRGDARRPRGRHRRQARRPGAGAGRRRHLEGPDRQRQLHGRQPDGPGPQHRRGGDRHRGRRPVEEDHGQRQRRDSPAQGDHQHDGRPAQRASPAK